MNRILIQLDEDPRISQSKFGHDVQNTINNIILQARDAQQARIARLESKVAAERELQAALEILYENPAGVTRSDLLAAADADNIISLNIRIQSYLKKHKIYTLRKRGKGSATIYFLQKLSDLEDD